MKVVLANVYSDDNRGSAALTIAAITLIRNALPDAAVAIVPIDAISSSQFRHTRAVFPDVTVLPAVEEPRSYRGGGAIAVGKTVTRLSASTRLVRRHVIDADLVVSRGGVIFRDGGSVRTALSLWMRILPLRYAISASVPLVILGAHVDPLSHRLERQMVRHVFRHAASVLPRDEVSAAHALGIGAPSSALTRIPDTVFALPSPAEDRTAALVARYDLPRGRFLAVALSPQRGLYPQLDAQIVDSFAHAVRSLVDSKRIEAVAVCVQTDGPLESDRFISRELVARLTGIPAVLIDDDLSPEELAALYGGAAAVTGTRLHACILSLVGGTPALPVEREVVHKMRSVFEDLGLSQYPIPVGDALSPDRLARSLQHVLDDRESRHRVTAAVTLARSRLDAVAQILKLTQER